MVTASMIPMLCLALATGGWISSAPIDTVIHHGIPRQYERIHLGKLISLPAVVDTAWATSLVDEVGREVESDTLGRPWTEWVRGTYAKDCEPYRGHSHTID